MERRLVVALLAGRIGLRKDAVVYRARFSNQTGPLELGLWNKSMTSPMSGSTICVTPSL
jgi:hypothetical protein